MKNSQRGSIALVLVIIAILVLGGGVYVYYQKSNSYQIPSILGEGAYPEVTESVVSVNNSPQQPQSTSQPATKVSNNPAPAPIVQKPAPIAQTSTASAKEIIMSALSKQNSTGQFRAMYSGTETASEGANSQTISFVSQEDKQNDLLRYALYKGSVYGSDTINKGFIGSIVETAYHFLNRDVSVSCVNTEQFCQATGNSFAEFFARILTARGMEIQSLSKLFGLNVYGEPNLMNITNAGAKNITFDTYISGKHVTQSHVCDLLNVNFSPLEVKKLASPSGTLSYETIDATKSTFNYSLCIDRASGLISEYSTNITIVSTDGQRQSISSTGKILGFSSEVISNNAFPFPSKVEQYNK